MTNSDEVKDNSYEDLNIVITILLGDFNARVG